MVFSFTDYSIRLMAVILVASVQFANFSRADIFEWEYVNPSDPSQGRQESMTLVPDGAGVDAIPGTSLFGLDLTMAYLEGHDLTGAGASTAVLSHAALAHANLTGAFFNGTNLTGADLTGAVIRGATFTDTSNHTGNLTDNQLYSTASFQAKSLQDMRFSIEMIGWNLAGQDLQGTHFQITVEGTDFSGANLVNTVWGARPINLEGTEFTAADARGARFNGAGQPVETNMIREDGVINGLHLVNNNRLLVRDDNGAVERDPIPITVRDALMLDPTGELHLLFEADKWDSFISFESGIPVSLGGGILRLDFADDVNVFTQVGRTLRIFDWTGVSPSNVFRVESDYMWDLSTLYTSGEITLLAVPEPMTARVALIAAALVAFFRKFC